MAAIDIFGFIFYSSDLCRLFVWLVKHIWKIDIYKSYNSTFSFILASQCLFDRKLMVKQTIDIYFYPLSKHTTLKMCIFSQEYQDWVHNADARKDIPVGLLTNVRPSHIHKSGWIQPDIWSLFWHGPVGSVEEEGQARIFQTSKTKQITFYHHRADPGFSSISMDGCSFSQ